VAPSSRNPLADSLRKDLAPSPEYALVQSLTQVKGEYSEAFLLCEERRAVVSVESTPLEYWLATTDPRDFALLKSEEATGKSGLSLLEHLSARYPMGAVSQK